MAIGDIRAGGGLATQLVSDRSSDISSQAISGLGDAVSRLAQTGLGYLNSRTDIEVIYDQRAMKSKGLELDTQFLQYQQDRAKEFTEFSRERSSAPAGMTKDYDALVGGQEAAFLATVPPRQREEMAARLAQDRATRVGSAFVSELSLLDTADTNNLNKGLNTLGSGLKGGGVSLEDAEAEWESMIAKTALPEETKQQFLESGKASLQGAEFGTIVEQAALGYGSVAPTTEGDVVAAGLIPQERAVLNALSSRESPGYNVWNGGTTFEGYEDHPAASGSVPGKSSAAGKYQFILGTWRAASAAYERKTGIKVPDFSPEWQDRVALSHAEDIFNKWNKSGLTFKAALASGDPEQILAIRRTLGNPKTSDPNSVEWEGWADRTFGPGGAAAADAAWLEVFTGEKGVAGGGTGPAEGPNVWTDPRFSSLSMEDKQGFANAAANAAEQQKQNMASQFKLERDAFLDSAYNAGYTSGDQSGAAEMQKSPYWDAAAAAKYNSGVEVFRASEKSSSDIGAALNTGTPLLSSQTKDFGKWFGSESLAGIANGAEAAMAKLRSAVSTARIFPEGSEDSFATALANPDTAPGAIDFLASALAGDSSILKRSGFSADLIAQAQMYKTFAENAGSPEQAFKDYTAASNLSATTGKTAGQLETEAVKLLSTSYPTADAVVDLFDGWFTRTPDTKLNENTGNQLMLDFSIAYQAGYKKFGTEEGAEAYAQTTIDNLWGTTQTKTFGGNAIGQVGAEGSQKPVLMKFPPENYYSSIEGDFGYLYSAISDFAVANGADKGDAVLLADEQTDREVRENKKPTYRVIGRDEFGGAMILPGRFGGDELDAEVASQVTEEANRKNAVSKVSSNIQQVLELDGKIKTAMAMGAPPEALDELQGQKLKFEKQAEVATLAATEQGYLAPVAALDPNDPMLDQSLKLLTEAMATDPTMERRITQLEKKYKAEGPADARIAALAEIVEKEMRITPAAAMEVVRRMMETKE